MSDIEAPTTSIEIKTGVMISQDDILRSSGNIAKILAGRRSTEHSPPTRDGGVSQSSESAVSTKDVLNKHQANISRLAQAFGLGGV